MLVTAGTEAGGSEAINCDMIEGGPDVPSPGAVLSLVIFIFVILFSTVLRTSLSDLGVELLRLLITVVLNNFMVFGAPPIICQHFLGS